MFNLRKIVKSGLVASLALLALPVIAEEDVALMINEKGQVGVGLTGEQEPDEGVTFQVQGRSKVNGLLNLAPLSEAPEDSQQGDVYLNTEGRIFLYFGTSWKEIQLGEVEPTVNRAKFVRVSIPSGYLSLAEVEVFSEGQNVAVLGTASQSSTGWGGVPARAIDGNDNGNWSGGSVTHTLNQANAWWEVELSDEVSIEKIIVTHRLGLHTRSNGFSITVLDAERNELYKFSDNTPSPVNDTFVLN